MERNTLRFYWRSRAETTIEHWDLQLCALVDDVVVGMCSVAADDFAVHRHAETGSWVGRRYQRRGIGREMRHAALHLIFAGLEADHATTGAWHDNAASLAVTRALPYTQTATAVQPRRTARERVPVHDDADAVGDGASRRHRTDQYRWGVHTAGDRAAQPASVQSSTAWRAWHR
ncbi:GNAT family N-acetyltransferase [Mycobacterium sp. Y57]|nr:GNAT family N-acetyltransferase [Mycolicibacterium xanthum]